MAVNKAPRSLNELLEEAVNVLQPAAAHKQMELITELSPLYLGVLADRDMLLQAAINLVSNAVKYTPEGGRVTVRSRLANDRSCLKCKTRASAVAGRQPKGVREVLSREERSQMAPARAWVCRWSSTLSRTCTADGSKSKANWAAAAHSA